MSARGRTRTFARESPADNNSIALASSQIVSESEEEPGNSSLLEEILRGLFALSDESRAATARDDSADMHVDIDNDDDDAYGAEIERRLMTGSHPLQRRGRCSPCGSGTGRPTRRSGAAIFLLIVCVFIVAAAIAAAVYYHSGRALPPTDNGRSAADATGRITYHVDTMFDGAGTVKTAREVRLSPNGTVFGRLSGSVSVGGNGSLWWTLRLDDATDWLGAQPQFALWIQYYNATAYSVRHAPISPLLLAARIGANYSSTAALMDSDSGLSLVVTTVATVTPQRRLLVPL